MMLFLQINWILFGLLALVHYSCGYNRKPIVGIMTQDLTFHKENVIADTYLNANYVKWLQMAGSRVVPILLDQSDNYYVKMFNSINGLLFPGGRLDLFSSKFEIVGRVLHKLALKANKEGDYFPIWGTCQGFELLSVIAADSHILSTCTGTEDVSLPLNFTPNASSSRLLRGMSDSLFSALENFQLTANFHQECLTPTNFSRNPNISKFYTVLSTNFDVNGKEFITTFEGREYPFYGTQWHPEKNNFFWTEKSHVNHSEIAISMSQYFANFFVEECRKSSHEFYSKEEETLASINQHIPIFYGYSSWKVFYYFNFTSMHDEMRKGFIEWNSPVNLEFFTNLSNSFQNSMKNCTNNGRFLMICFAFGMVVCFILGVLLGRRLNCHGQPILWTSEESDRY